MIARLVYHFPLTCQVKSLEMNDFFFYFFNYTKESFTEQMKKILLYSRQKPITLKQRDEIFL